MLKTQQEIARSKVLAIVVGGVDGQSISEAIQRILASRVMRWAEISNAADGPEFATLAIERVANVVRPT